MPLWPIEDGRGVGVPGVGRTAVIPLTGNRPPTGTPPFFDPMDPTDIDLFAFDWTLVAFASDPIVSAIITSTPPVLTISTPVLSGGVVQMFIGPATIAGTCDIACGVTFASGRVLDWGCEIAVRSF